MPKRIKMVSKIGLNFQNSPLVSGRLLPRKCNIDGYIYTNGIQARDPMTETNLSKLSEPK